MKSLRHLASALIVLVFTVMTMSPASAAPRITLGPVIPPFPPPVDISFPPVAVGELHCSNGVVFGNFSDPDQDDATLRVVGISAGEPGVEYSAVRAWGTFIAVIPAAGNHVNLVAYDKDGNRAVHRSLYMLEDGSCRD